MKKLILITLLLHSAIYSAHATHLRAGQITVKQIPGRLTCAITITVFTNTKNTTVLFGGEQDELNFGDGSPITLVPETYNTIRTDLNPDGSLAMASYTTYHTYSTPGKYLISYREPNRNEGIINMDNSVNTTFYIETWITLTLDGTGYQTPTLLMDRPVLLTNAGFNYSESLACSDPNNYQLYYTLATPRRDREMLVENYILPENVSIDPVSGLLTWDGKFKGANTVGEYAFAVKIYQVKDGEIIGYMLRDFQVILTADMTEQPTLVGNAQDSKSVFVADGTTTRFRVAAGSSEAKKIILQVKSELATFENNFTYTIEDSTHNAVNYKVAKISITNTDAIVRNTPYQIIVRGIFDNKVTKDLAYVIATKDIDFETDIPVGTEDNHNLPGIVLTPNPVKNHLQIQNDTNTSTTIRIHDLTGKLWHQQTIRTTTSINLTQLPPGLYICILTQATKLTTYKIIKE